MNESGITARFRGDAGLGRIAKRIKNVGVVGGSDAVASALAEAGELVVAAANEELVQEGGHETDIYFLLMGEAELLVKQRRTADLSAPAQIGELAALRCEPRSATIRSLGNSVWLRVSQDSFESLLAQYPQMWESLCRDLAHRLATRTGLVRPRNKRSRLFVGSSAERIEFIRSIRQNFNFDTNEVQVVLWTDLFQAGDMTLAKLQAEVEQADFGLFILHPDDLTESRDEIKPAPRDNVLLELGMFFGRLGSERTLFATPRIKNLKLPSDLDGITPISYPDIETTGIEEAMRFVADAVRKTIKRRGPA